MTNYIEEMCKCAGIILVRKQKGEYEYVLVETRQKKFNYSFPKGKREGNESIQETAKREVYEETGLKDTDYKLVPDLYYIEYLRNSSSGVSNPHIVYYVAFVEDESVEFCPIDTKEVVSCKWFRMNDTSSMTSNLTFQRRKIVDKSLVYLKFLE